MERHGRGARDRKGERVNTRGVSTFLVSGRGSSPRSLRRCIPREGWSGGCPASGRRSGEEVGAGGWTRCSNTGRERGASRVCEEGGEEGGDASTVKGASVESAWVDIPSTFEKKDASVESPWVGIPSTFRRLGACIGSLALVRPSSNCHNISRCKAFYSSRFRQSTSQLSGNWRSAFSVANGGAMP